MGRMETPFTQSSQVIEKSALQIELREPIFECRNNSIIEQRIRFISGVYCLRWEYCSCPSLGSQHKHILVRPPGMAEVSKMQEQFSTKKNAGRRSTHRGR